jgi:uncharacterized protein (DUF4415 family)
MKRRSDPEDAPALTGKELMRPDVKWRIGGKEVSPQEGKAAFRAALGRKTRVNIHLDNDLIAHYKAKAQGRGYQTLINAALRRDMEQSQQHVAGSRTIDQTRLITDLKASILRDLKASIRVEMDRFVQLTWHGTVGTARVLSDSQYEPPDYESDILPATVAGTSNFYVWSTHRSSGARA